MYRPAYAARVQIPDRPKKRWIYDAKDWTSSGGVLHGERGTISDLWPSAIKTERIRMERNYSRILTGRLNFSARRPPLLFRTTTLVYRYQCWIKSFNYFKSQKNKITCLK